MTIDEQYTIRLAEIKDADTLYEGERRTFSVPWTAESIAGWISGANRCYYLACCKKTGYLAAYVGLLFIGNEAEIVAVGTLPEYRRQGLGKLLVQHAIKTCRERDIESIFLEVRDKNLPAIALYRSCGFKEIGLRKGYYEDSGEDAVIMKV